MKYDGKVVGNDAGQRDTKIMGRASRSYYRSCRDVCGRSAHEGVGQRCQTCPEFLPDTFQYRMWLLRYAAQHSPEAESGDHEAHCKKFADRVAKIADSLAGGIYHKKLQLLQDSLKYLHDKNPARVACYLGDISKTRLSWLTKPDLLRVELAAGLLKKKSGVKGLMDEDLEKRVEAMMESWRASENEEVRILGVGYE